MFKLDIKKETNTNEIDETRLLDALMHFSFLTGYSVKNYKEGEEILMLISGSVMSLNPNSLKHTISIDKSKTADGRLTIIAGAETFPWEKSKIRQILSHRITQLISYLYSQSIIPEDSITDAEKETTIVKAPFTHLPGSSLFYYITSFLKVLLGMSLCITGAVFIIWIYGIIIIGIKDSRLFFEVTFGAVPTKELIGGGSVIGIAIGYAVGAILSIYFAFCEVSEFLNKRILSFGIFYTLLLCFFIIEEELFILTSLAALCVPFCAYVFYYLVWGLKRVYIKDER
jgi:hypothetical protein